MKKSIATLGLAAALGGAAALLGPAAPAGAGQPLARAVLRGTSGAVVGEVVFKGQGAYANRVEVELDAPGAPNLGRFHGLHVHTTGICDPAPSGTANVPFGSAGGHWNPTGASHGDHAGDLPSVLLGSGGKAYAEFETHRFDVVALLDAGGDGAAVILHDGRDNFANIPAAYGTPNAGTLATGDAGARYACGTVRPA